MHNEVSPTDRSHVVHSAHTYKVIEKSNETTSQPLRAGLAHDYEKSGRQKGSILLILLNDHAAWSFNTATATVVEDVRLPNYRVRCVGHGTRETITCERVTCGNVAYRMHRL